MRMRGQEPWAGGPQHPRSFGDLAHRASHPPVWLQNKGRTFPAEEQNVRFQEL